MEISRQELLEIQRTLENMVYTRDANRQMLEDIVIKIEKEKRWNYDEHSDLDLARILLFVVDSEVNIPIIKYMKR